MNRWQQYYCDELYEGKMPRNKIGKCEFDLLGKCSDIIKVDFPRGSEIYTITLNECNMPKGKIDVLTLAANLRLWAARGWSMTTNSSAKRISASRRCCK